MRYYSFPIQKMRHRSDLLSGLQEEGFVGVYARVENLNPHRFDGKEQSADVWRSVFPYYFQLWYSEILSRVLRELSVSVDQLAAVESEISREISDLLETDNGPKLSSFDEVIGFLSGERRLLDSAVNNCGITGELDTHLMVSPGVLLRGIPAIVRDHCEPLSNVRFHYILDEFELFLSDQQRYVHTLLRELGEPPEPVDPEPDLFTHE